MEARDDWIEALVRRNTVNGQVRIAADSIRMQVRFTRTRAHCYLADGRVLRRVKEGHKGGVMKGQFEDIESGDMYDVQRCDA